MSSTFTILLCPFEVLTACVRVEELSFFLFLLCGKSNNYNYSFDECNHVALRALHSTFHLPFFSMGVTGYATTFPDQIQLK